MDILGIQTLMSIYASTFLTVRIVQINSDDIFQISFTSKQENSEVSNQYQSWKLEQTFTDNFFNQADGNRHIFNLLYSLNSNLL